MPQSAGFRCWAASMPVSASAGTGIGAAIDVYTQGAMSGRAEAAEQRENAVLARLLVQASRNGVEPGRCEVSYPWSSPELSGWVS